MSPFLSPTASSKHLNVHFPTFLLSYFLCFETAPNFLTQKLSFFWENNCQFACIIQLFFVTLHRN